MRAVHGLQNIQEHGTSGLHAKVLRKAEPQRSVLREAIEAAGSSAALVAQRLGLSGTRVRDWCNPVEDASISERHLLRLSEACPSVFGAYVSALARIRDARPGPGLSQESHVRKLTRELGEASEVLDAALVDGAISQDEARSLDKELADIEARVAAARADLRKHL